MANLTGHAETFAADTSVVETVTSGSPSIQLGTRARDAQGNEYIFLQGAASTAAGSWVTYNHLFATALLAADAVGPVAIAMAAVSATTKYGWYQIFGKNTIASTDTVASGAPLYIDGTAGRADDAGVAGDFIAGAWTRSADTANVATVQLSYPFVSNNGYLT